MAVRVALHARSELHVLSAERIREELLKILSAAPRPSAALGLYAASGVLEVLCPEAAATLGVRARPEDPGDPWAQGVLTADALPGSRSLLRLAATLRCVGLPGPGEVEPPSGPDPGVGESRKWVRGHLRAVALLERLRFSNAEVREVAGLVEALLLPPPPRGDPVALRRWLSRVGRVRIRGVSRILLAEARIRKLQGREDATDLLELVRDARAQLVENPALELGELAVGGRDLLELGLDPGPRVGEILERLLEDVLERPSLNRPDVLKARARELIEFHVPGGKGDGRG